MMASLDEIFDALDVLRRDADNLYRYGDPINSAILFQQMSNDDRRKVIYCALTVGDKAVRDTANHLMQQLDPIPNSVHELSSQMDPRHKCEIDVIVEQGGPHRIISREDLRRINQVLCEACCSLSGLTQEEAYWVLIPRNPSDAVVRIGAMSIAGEMYILYDPEKKETRELFAAMRRSSWVLHIHNHPVTAGEQNAYSASPADLEFARYWKSLRGELAGKMKFFIIDQNTAFEYTENQSHAVQWLGERIENKPLSCVHDEIPEGQAEEVPEDQVVDAHTHWASLSKKQKKKWRKYIWDMKRRRKDYIGGD